MTKEEIQKMLKHAKREAVYSFISAYAESNTEFCAALKAALLPDRKMGLNKEIYLTNAEDCFNFEGGGQGWRSYHYNFYQAAYDASSRLDKMLSEADYFIEQGEYAPAAGIAMSVAEVIPRNYENVDDSSGTLGGSFNTATECLVAILYNAHVPEKLKEDIYEWTKQEMNDSVYSDYGFDSLIDVYDAACEELGETSEVLADLDEQIEKANMLQKERVVLRKIQFMQSRNLDTKPVVDKYLEMDAVRRIRFDQLMEEELFDEALVLARRGIEIAVPENHWQAESEWKKLILEIYLKQGDVKNILFQAEELLCNNYYDNDRYYQIVKEYTHPNEWKNTLERILKSFENSSRFCDFIADIMVEYQLWERLFAYCKMRDDDVQVLENYEPHLKPHFEQEILDIYLEYVEKQALITDSSAYVRVARMLKRMRGFKGGNAVVDQLLQEYRNIYKRRKNMMAALRDV